METKEFRVGGMTCGGCESTLRKAISFVDGVARTDADHTSGRVVVTFDPARASAEAIERAIEDAGYQLVGA